MAKALRKWLRDVVQACEPWISSEDIDPGARWSSDLANQLEQTEFGIICLTPENLKEPWIHFEAGALSKKLDDKTRLCPYLLGFEPTTIKGPLIQFQAVKAEEEGTRKLIQAINHALGSECLDEERLERAFENNWHYLDEELKKIVENPKEIDKPSRTEKDMLEEILKTVREHSRIFSELLPSKSTRELFIPVKGLKKDLFSSLGMPMGDICDQEFTHTMKEFNEAYIRAIENTIKDFDGQKITADQLDKIRSSWMNSIENIKCKPIKGQSENR
jgi:hypothetical protein